MINTKKVGQYCALIDVINEYSEDSTFYSIAYTMLLNFDNLQNLPICSG